MKCYRVNCKYDCDDFKKRYCLLKINEEQYNFKQRIRNSSNIYCNTCSKRTVKAKYYIKDKQYVVINLCTNDKCKKEILKLAI